ncbi:MAG: glycosyltransferase family 39 protein [Aggregatilineales bacterium]
MRRYFLLLATIILLIAAVLRLSQLNTHPPGPHFDESANILITRSIAFGGADLFPITNSYQGRETLYHYYNAVLFRLIGDGEFTMRLSSVYVAMLTIAASMALGRAMFRGQRGIIIGLVVGVLMTTSFHQVLMARQMYRAITLPFMQSFALLFLWRGLNAKQQGWRWLVLGGFFAGGALYTYMASRLFPVWLLLAGIALLYFDRAHFRKRLVQGFIFFGVLAITSIPIVAYALNNPDIFFGRLNEVTNESDVVVTLEQSIRRHAEMFFIRGEDGNLRYNIPGRPYFNPVEGVFLILGMGYALRLLVRRGKASERAGYFLILLSPLMVIPSVISLGGFPPNHMRSLGMVPLIFFLPALGIEFIWNFVRQRVTEIKLYQWRYALGIVFVAVFGASSLIVAGQYFRWANRADLFYQTDGDLAAVAEWLPAHVDDDTIVYVASYHREHPTLITGWSGQVTWMGFDSLFLPPPDKHGLYIFTNNAETPSAWTALLEEGRVTDVPLAPDGLPAFQAYTRMGETTVSNNDAIQSTLMTFVDSQSPPTPAGERALFEMRWRIDQTPPYYRLRPVLELTDQSGNLIARNDLFLLGTDQWRAGEVMIQNVPFTIPIGTPAGNYSVRVSWADRDSETFVPFIDETGAYAGISAEIGSISVIRPQTIPSPDTLQIDNRQDIDLSDGVRLLGWNNLPMSARPGGDLRLSFFWQALGVDESRSVDDLEVRFLSENGDIITLWMGQPFDGDFPVEAWTNGELLREYVAWSIPPDLASGRNEIVLISGDVEIALGEIAVDGIPRVFAPSEVDTVVNQSFDGLIALYGYSLNNDNGLLFEPVWVAQSEIDEDFTVFVHIVDENGIIVTQRDLMPRQNSYPTSLWTTGEYIADSFYFADLPDGSYTLRVGLYIQSSGFVLNVNNEIMKDISTEFIEISEITITND